MTIGPNRVANSAFEIDTGHDFFNPPLDGAPDSWSIGGTGAGVCRPSVDSSFPDLYGPTVLQFSNQGPITTGNLCILSQESIPPGVNYQFPYRFSLYLAKGTMNNCHVQVSTRWHTAGHAAEGPSDNSIIITAGQLSTSQFTRFDFDVPSVGGTHNHLFAYIAIVADANMVAGDGVIYVKAVQFQHSTLGAPGPYAPRYADLAVTDPNAAGDQGSGACRFNEYAFNGLLMNQGYSPFSGDADVEDSDSAFFVIVEKCSGLWDMPPIKTSGDYEDAANHGGVLGQERISKRVVTMDIGIAGGTDDYPEASMMNRLAWLKHRLIPNSTDRPLTFRRRFDAGTDHYSHYYGTTKKYVLARVRGIGGFDTDYEGYNLAMLRGSIQFECADPAMYDYVSSVDNRVISTTGTSYDLGMSRGNFRTYPVITVSGPVTNPVINCQPIGCPESFNRSIRYLGTIAAGHSVTFDAKARSAITDLGVDVRANLDPSNQWFYFPSAWVNPGLAVTRLQRMTVSFASGTPTVKIVAHDAWI